MICSNRTGSTDTRCSLWGQKPLNVLQRLHFLKLKPIPWGLWSPQVSRALATVWASGGPPESKQRGLWGPRVLGCLGCRQAPSRSTESCLLLTPMGRNQSPTTPMGGTGRALSPFNSPSLPPGAGSYHLQLELTHEPRQHLFCGRLTAN